MVDEELASVMRDLKALGGPKLFEYLDSEGRVRPITPRDVWSGHPDLAFGVF